MLRRPDAEETADYYDLSLKWKWQWFSIFPWWSLRNMNNPLLVPARGIQVDVEPCEVVVFIGHNDKANPIRFYGPKCRS